MKTVAISMLLIGSLSLAFGVVALADTASTEWKFSGAGTIEINMKKSGGPCNGSDYLYLETYGGGSSGWSEFNVQGPPHAYWPEGTTFQVRRHVKINDGMVTTTIKRHNHGMPGEDYYWHCDTTYTAYLDVSSSGKLNQTFQNSYFLATTDTDISANGSYDMFAGVVGKTGGHFSFGIGASGDGHARLGLDTGDYAAHTGARCLQGNFDVFASGSTAGFGAKWGSEATFWGTAETPYLSEDFTVAVSGGPGSYLKSYSGDWVNLIGTIFGGQYRGMK